MPGNYLQKQIFPFFNSVKKPVTETGTSDSFCANYLYSTMNIEVSGVTSGDIIIEGCINILNKDGSNKKEDECVWTKLSFVDLSTMTLGSSIVSDGIYSVGIDGMSRVRIVINSISGSATIVGVAGV